MANCRRASFKAFFFACWRILLSSPLLKPPPPSSSKDRFCPWPLPVCVMPECTSRIPGAVMARHLPEAISNDT